MFLPMLPHRNQIEVQVIIIKSLVMISLRTLLPLSLLAVAGARPSAHKIQ